MNQENLLDRNPAGPELVVFSAARFDELLQKVGNTLQEEGLLDHRPGFLRWLSCESQDAWSRHAQVGGYRAAVTASGEAELQRKLVQLEKMVREKPDEAFSYPAAGLYFGVGPAEGRLAFLFPGQGSQYIGMGRELAAAYPLAREVWDVLGAMRFDGSSLSEIVNPPPAGSKEEYRAQALRLAGADWTNACISVAGEALLQLLECMGVVPDAVASHSWGDFNAYRAAGIVSPEDMIRFTRFRGERGVRSRMATRGCILAAFETAEMIQNVIREHGFKQVWIANYNAPGLMVLSGLKAEILEIQGVLEAKGVTVALIPISAGVHCPLADDPEAIDPMAEMLETMDFHSARCDVYSYLFGRKVENNAVVQRRTITAQIPKPVRFITQTENMYKDGIRTFVEVGPSDVLTGCVRQILDGKPHAAICMGQTKGGFSPRVSPGGCGALCRGAG